VNIGYLMAIIFGAVIGGVYWHGISSAAQRLGEKKRRNDGAPVQLAQATQPPTNMPAPEDARRTDRPPQLTTALSPESQQVHKAKPPQQQSKSHEPPQDEARRRAALLDRLRQEYTLSRDNISAALIAGTEQPPADWINKRLREMGEAWAVSPAAKQRRLSDVQKTKLRDAMVLYKGQRVSIDYPIGHDEELEYARDFLATLQEAGWQASLGLPQVTTLACDGVAVSVVRDEPNKPAPVPVAAEALAQALESLGITVVRATMEGEIRNDGLFHLIICRKPTPSAMP